MAAFLQWHRAEVQRPPEGARVLAGSPRCAIQALAVGEHAFGLQGHVEVDAATLDQWLSTPAAVAELERALGPDGPARFAAEARAHMAACNRAARRLYANFMTLVTAAARAPA